MKILETVIVLQMIISESIFKQNISYSDINRILIKTLNRNEFKTKKTSNENRRRYKYK